MGDGQHAGSVGVTRLLSAIADGDSRAADELLPVVYEELRRLARSHLGKEAPGQTLQATALVHEAYVRLVGPVEAGEDAGGEARYAGSRHFFAAAALAMRRILVDRAREKRSLKRGGGAGRRPLLEGDAVAETTSAGESGIDVVALDEVLRKFAGVDERRAQVVNLRYFAGLSIEQTAAALGVSPATVKTDWAFARAWLLRELDRSA